MVQNVYVSAVTPDNISRTELLAWVNDTLQSSFAKIEEMSTGTAYCLFTDVLFSASIPLKRVKWNSKNEVDHINNWKILQTSWKTLGIDKPVPVEKLLKAKFQAQVSECFDSISAIEQERNFYFEKLRKVEDLCNAEEGDLVKKILNILYETDNGEAQEGCEPKAENGEQHTEQHAELVAAHDDDEATF